MTGPKRTRALGSWLIQREESLAVQSVILTAARAVGFVITFAIPLVLVRLFDQDGFGLYKQLFLLAGTAVPILNLGLYASLFYFVPRDPADGQRYISQAIGILSLSGAAAAIALILGADRIATLFDSPALRVHLPLLGLFIFIATPSEIFAAPAVVDRRPTLAALVMSLSDIARAMLLIGAALLLGTITAVLWAAVAAAALRCCWLLAYLRIRAASRHRPANRRDLSGQLRYSLPFAAAVLFEIGLGRFHEYFVAARVSTAEYAVYAVGVLQLPVIGMLVQSVVEVMLIRAAEAHKAGDRHGMRHVWRTSVHRLAIVLVPCWMIAEILAPELIGLLFGATYLGAVPVFRIFTCTVLLWILVDHGILRATGDTPYLVRANAAALVVSVVAVVMLSRVSIPLGAIAGYLIGIAAMRCMGLVRVASRLDLPLGNLLPWADLARVMLAAMGSGLLTAMVLSVLDVAPIVRLLVGGSIFAAVYLASVLRFRLVPHEEILALLRRFVPAYR